MNLLIKLYIPIAVLVIGIAAYLLIEEDTDANMSSIIEYYCLPEVAQSIKSCQIITGKTQFKCILKAEEAGYCKGIF